MRRTVFAPARMRLNPPMEHTKGMKTANCPSWCRTEHPEGETEPSSHFGPHWPPLPGDVDFSVDVAAMQTGADVVVFLSADHKEHLTPLEARSVSRALLAAATWVDNHRA